MKRSVVEEEIKTMSDVEFESFLGVLGHSEWVTPNQFIFYVKLRRYSKIKEEKA